MLREAGAVEKTIPDHVAWVRRFFVRFPGRRRRDLGRAEIETFLTESSRLAGVSNWQLSQARASLETYYEQFRGIALAPRPDRSETAPDLSSATEPEKPRSIEPALSPDLSPVSEELAPPYSKRETTRKIVPDLVSPIIPPGNPPAPKRKPVADDEGSGLRDTGKGRMKNMHEVEVPGALAVKYPNAPYEWPWQ